MYLIVTGAAGWLGQYICREAQHRKWHVIGIDITEPAQGCSEFFQSDITSPIRVELPRHDNTALVHCAGYVHKAHETEKNKSQFYAVNSAGTRNVLDWCRQECIQRLVYLSTISVYDWQRSELPAPERAPLKLDTHYARSKYEGEEAVLSSGMDACALRMATVFGTGDCAMFSKLAKALKARRFIMPGQGAARKSVIPVDLAAKLIVDIVSLPEIPHEPVNISLPKPPTLGEICTAYSEHCGFAFPPQLPSPLLTVIGAVGSLLDSLCGHCPITLAEVRKLQTTTIVAVNRMNQYLPGRAFPSFSEALATHRGYYRDI